MQKTFKCCRNKEFTNFCCIVCSSIFHPSCMERSNEIIKLGGYNIFCSTKCQIYNKDNEERLAAMNQDIQRLRDDLDAKDKHINRLKRNSMAFDDEVYEAEKKFTAQIEHQSREMETLQDELKKLKTKENELVMNLTACKKLEENLNRQIEELTTLNKNMVVSIEVLEKENDSYTSELKQLRLQLLDSRLRSQENPQEESNVLSGHNTGHSNNNACRQNGCILIAGSDVRGYLPLLKMLTSRKYDINSQKLKKTSIMELLTLSLPYCQNFTKKDFVFLFADAQDSYDGKKKLCAPVIEKKLAEFQHTNLILISPMSTVNRPVVNKIIAAHNSIIENCCKYNPNCSFIPLISPWPIAKNHIAEYLVNCYILNDIDPNYLQETVNTDVPIISANSHQPMTEKDSEPELSGIDFLNHARRKARKL